MSWKRGAYPEFSLEDVIAAMFLLKKPVGRKFMAELLNLGEGSVRTILRKLSSLGLIQSTQRGHSLREEGRKLMEEIENNFSEVSEVGRVGGVPAYALVVRNPGKFKSIELRDEAIRFFAKGAMILIIQNGEPVFPEDLRPLSKTMPELSEKIRRAFDLKEGDMVVVTWAESPADAMKSAYHVALVLKEDWIPEELKTVVR